MKNIELEAKKIIYQWKKSCESLDDRYLNDEAPDITPQETIALLVGNDLFTDKNLVKEMCKQAPNFLTMNNIKIAAFCSEAVRNEREVALEIIKTNGKNFEVLDSKFRDDKEFVLEALQHDSILEYASASLRDDDQVVNFAVSRNAKSIVFASDRFTGDKEFILAVLKKDEYVLQYLNQYIHNNLRNDIEFLSDCWKTVSERYTNDRVALQYHAKTLLEYMSDDLKPIFSQVELGDKNIKQRIEACFNHYILNNELNSENQIKTKKLKV